MNHGKLYNYDREKTVIHYDEKDKILLRKRQLFDHLNDKKLEYKKNGICDSFIKYGTPALNIVINDVQRKTEIQIKRFNKLVERLHQEGEKYDDNIKYYRQYIKNGGDLEYHVEEGIKEWFYKNKTNYLELLKIYKDEDKAQIHAFNMYVRKHGSDKYIERIRKSEMVVRLL